MATTKVTFGADEIHPKTPTGLRVVFTKNAGNKTAVALTAIDPNDYITRQQFDDNIPAPLFSYTIKIPATTSIPKNLLPAAFVNVLNANPTVLTQVPTPGDGTGTKLTYFNDIGVQINYTDNTFSVIASIDIYGHDNGSGQFAEDTYVTIKN